MSEQPFDRLRAPLSPLSSPASPLALCDNLVKIYKVADPSTGSGHHLEVVALQGLDLEVGRGEMLGLVGPSGSGKTTLLNVLGGLDRPSAGRVVVDSQDLLKLSGAALDRYRRHKVGFVWQQVGRNLIPYLTAQENVELPMTLAGVAGKARHAWALELLEAVGLADRRGHKLAQLSGGEQQRVAIAVALANKPILLLADEPTGEVDSATAQVIYQTFRRLNAAYGLTTIIVTHDLHIAEWVDRVVGIRDGRTATEVRGESRDEREEEGGLSTLSSQLSPLTIVDSAGRLQVPAEYLEEAGIGDRVRLEIVEEGILIRPVAGEPRGRGAEEQGSRGAQEHGPVGVRADEEPPSPRLPWWRAVLDPFRRW